MGLLLKKFVRCFAIALVADSLDLVRHSFQILVSSLISWFVVQVKTQVLWEELLRRSHSENTAG